MSENSLFDILLNRDPLPPLEPGAVWKHKLSNEIDSLDEKELVKAGLHLLNDDIDRCHSIAQDTPTDEGNYWHAILHRREPDYFNSKYWYRRVAEHPVYSQLREEFQDWDPFEFVDWCESSSWGGGVKSVSWLEDVQAKEMGHLLNYLMGDSR